MTLNDLCDQIAYETEDRKDVYLVDASDNDLDGFEVNLEPNRTYWIAKLLTQPDRAQPDRATIATLLEEIRHLRAENERFAIVIRRVSEANEQSAAQVIEARQLLQRVLYFPDKPITKGARVAIETFLNGGSR